MRLGLKSYNPIVIAMDWLGILPTPLLETFWGMEMSRALIAAVRLGLFDALADEPKTATTVAHELGYDEVGVEALLNALNGFGYLKRRDGRYSLRRSARRWLTRDARYSLTRTFGLFRVLWSEMDDMEERVRSGGVRDFHRRDRDAAFWRDYEIGLGQFARVTAPVIARSVRLKSPPGRLLDVGGGHGAYSAAFCRRHPQLHAEVLDLAPAAAIGRELIAEQDLADRVTFRDGDLLTDAWGEGYDVVLIFNVLHILTPEDAARALKKAHSALNPGGTLVVVDSVHSGSRGNIDSVGGGSELLFYVINNTRTYSEETMVEWIRVAGFSQTHRRHLLAMPEALITAHKAM